MQNGLPPSDPPSFVPPSSVRACGAAELADDVHRTEHEVQETRRRAVALSSRCEITIGDCCFEQRPETRRRSSRSVGRGRRRVYVFPLLPSESL